MADLEDRKRSRDDSGDSGEDDLSIDSPEVKRLREDLLETLEDDESEEICTAVQDLDSFMKSFEEEIAASPPPQPSAAVTEAEDGESRPDLGYLLEASDDELGLPPTAASSELGSDLVRVDSDSSELGSEFWEIPDYDDGFGFGFGVTEEAGGNGGNGGEYVALDGLFDYSDMGFGSGGVGPRPETLPA